MKKIRYYTRMDGVTRKSIDALKHLPRLGTISNIRAYRIKTDRSGMISTNEYVMVTGEHGTARFSGFCWGYGGEGPRGTEKLLQTIGLPPHMCENAAYRQPRYDQLGTDWELKLIDGQWKILTGEPLAMAA
jgi:hypothetical protein